jgi:hypothetical protein
MVQITLVQITLRPHKPALLAVVLFSLFIILCLSAAAIKEGESEFFKYNKQDLVLTVLSVNQDGTADVMLSKPVPDFTKTINVGESQRYYSNWQCFVTTLMKVENSKSNVYISSCYDEDEEEVNVPVPAPTSSTKPVTPAKVVEPADTTAADTTADASQTPSSQADVPVINDSQIIISEEGIIPEEKLPTEQYPQESFLEKDVKLGSVLLAGLILLLIIMIVLLAILISVKKDDF